jgi:hypothetical protein
MGTGDSNLRRVRAAITELIRNKSQSSPRVWSDVEAIRYRNLCELEQVLLTIETLEVAAS